METKDFYYDLPKELIAQTPLEPRDSSRLLVMNKTSGELEHRHFYDIIEYLQKEVYHRCKQPTNKFGMGCYYHIEAVVKNAEIT